MPGSPNTMSQIDYSFDPGQSVWIIQGCGSNLVVVQASVVRVIGVVTSVTPVVTYNVSMASVPTSTVTVGEVDMFHTLENAMAEYERRLDA